MNNASPRAPRIISSLSPSNAPTSAEACVARQEADKLLDALKPAVVAMLLGKPAPFHHVDHVSEAGLLQVVVTRTVIP